MNKRAELKIYGRVQGVFFRDSVRKKARELNLTGWVRNDSDGTVCVVVEGEEKNLQELVNWCRRGGPDSAEVKSVDIEWTTASGQFKDFKIRFGGGL